MAGTAHDAVFIWPSTGPNKVTLTGTFDNWSSSVPLTKGPNGFSGKISIPWGEKILYKFIVDGTWSTADEQATEADSSGNLNNVYTAPAQPDPPATPDAPTGIFSSIMAAASRTLEEVSAAIDAPVAKTPTLDVTHRLPAPVQEAGDSAAATAGMSSAVEYLVSGVGVTGSDPVNKDRIPAEDSAMAEAPVVETADEGKPAQEALAESAPSGPLAPDVPVPIVLVKDASTDTAIATTTEDTAATTHTLDVPETVAATISAVSTSPPVRDHATETATASPAAGPPPPTAANAPIPVSVSAADGPTADPTALVQATVESDIQAAVAAPKPSEVAFPTAEEDKEAPSLNGATHGSPPASRSPSGKYDSATMRKKRGSIFGSIRSFPSSHEKLPGPGEHIAVEGETKHESQRKERRTSIFGKIKGAFSPSASKKRSVSGSSEAT